MTCTEFKELAAAYALGALGAETRAALEEHLAEPVAHDGCQEALRRMNDAAALLALALTPVDPAPAVWRLIEQRIAGGDPARRGQTWYVTAALAAAAVLLLLLWVGDRRRLATALRTARDQAASGEQQRARCLADLEKLRRDDGLRQEAIALLARPGTRLVGLAAQDGGGASARVILHSGEHRAYLIGHGLRPRSGSDYELWMIRGERKIAAGLLRAGEDGQLVTAVDPALLAEGPPDAMAVTLEPEGGGPAPRGPIVMLGAI